MKRRIGFREFLGAFEEAIKECKPEASDYSDSTRWTLRMCGSPAQPGVIPTIAKYLRPDFPLLEARHQWYTLDAVLVEHSQEPGWPEGYPPYLHCIIEHENGDKWHEEMWKLAHWRSPLKVLVVYDFNDDLKESEGRKRWVEDRIHKLRIFLRATDELHGREESDYLLIVGSKEEASAESVNWKACLLNDDSSALRPFSQILSDP